MLGDIIYEGQGKLENRRIVGIKDGNPLLEGTISQTGVIKGIDVTNLVTYNSILQSDGTIYGEGFGLISTLDGSGRVTWKGQSIARIAGETRRDIGSIFYNTDSTKKLSFLKDLVGVFEYETRNDGKIKGIVWEWK